MLAAVYGGYFGAALGVAVLALLGVFLWSRVVSTPWITRR